MAANNLTTSQDFIERQTLMEAISHVFVRNPILLGTPAAIVRSDLTETIQGRTVEVPYWADIGNFVKVAEDQAVPVRKLSQTSEKSTVQRAGVAIQATVLARIINENSGDDMYEEIANQVREKTKIFLDNELLDLALQTDLVYTAGVGAVVGTPTKVLDWVEAIKASLVWTDDGDTDPVLLGVHTKPYGDLLTKVDSNGRPLIEDSMLAGRLKSIAGVPLRRSNRLPVNTVPNPDEYTSILARANAMALWYAPPIPESDKDILVHTDLLAFQLYYVSHLYKRVAGVDQKGVVRIVSQ